MGVVAIAGGTGDVGRTIVEHLVQTGNHKIVVLTRKVLDTPKANGAEFLTVNYDDVEATARALEALGVDTIISTVSPEGPTAEQSQLNLIAAAEKSATTKRFLPGEWATFTADENPDEASPMVAPFLHMVQALKKTGLEYTRFSNGMFMDYYGQPHIPTHLRPFGFGINIAQRRAAIPGTGDEVVSLTYSKDIPRFVGRLLDEDKWPQFSIVSGSDTSLNEILAIAEKVTGEKFDVTYDSVEKLKGGKATSVFSSEAAYGDMDPEIMAAFLGMEIVEGKMAQPKEGRLNEKFPEIVPMGIEELITKAWGKK